MTLGKFYETGVEGKAHMLWIINGVALYLGDRRVASSISIAIFGAIDIQVRQVGPRPIGKIPDCVR